MKITSRMDWHPSVFTEAELRWWARKFEMVREPRNPDEFYQLVLCARPRHFSTQEIQRAREWLQTYAYRLDPPDEQTIAEFLAVAPWPHLEAMLYKMVRERVPAGEYYFWFVRIALQRIHGIVFVYDPSVMSPQIRKAPHKLRLIRSSKREIV